MNRPGRRLAAAVVLLVAPGAAAIAACATESVPEPAAGAWGAATVVQELAIGVEFGVDALMFGGVRDVAVAGDGRIYVCQLQPVVIREYDAEGNYVRDVGREGQGPGEYQSPAIETTPDGRLAVWDPFSNRLTLFDRQGEVSATVRAEASLGGAQSFFVDIEGNVYLRDWERTEEPVTSEADIPQAFRKLSPGGELLESIPIPPQDRDESAGRSFTLREGFESFPVATLSAWSPLGYLVVGRNDRYAIELRKPSGTITIARELARATLNDEEMAEWQRFHARTREINADLDIRWAPVPDTKPYFSRLDVGQDGRVWVRRYVEAVKRHDIEPLRDAPERPLLTWREPPTYDVFEPDGAFLGTVVLPNEFTPYFFRGDRVWGVHIDADGVERVVRLRIDPS